MGTLLGGLGTAHLIAGHDEEALSMALWAIQERPSHLPAHALAIVSFVLLGRLDEAKAAARRLLEIAPSYSVSGRARLLPYKDQAHKDRYLNALRAAGIPE